MGTCPPPTSSCRAPRLQAYYGHMPTTRHELEAATAAFKKFTLQSGGVSALLVPGSASAPGSPLSRKPSSMQAVAGLAEGGCGGAAQQHAGCGRLGTRCVGWGPAACRLCVHIAPVSQVLECGGQVRSQGPD